MSASGPATAKTAIVLVNPKAGKGRAAKAAGTAQQKLKELGLNVTEYEAKTAQETRELAVKAVTQKPDTLVVVGGDGTLAAVLNAVTESDVAVTLIPAGTGNDFARAMGIPCGSAENIQKAATLAATGTPKLVDVAEAETPEGKTKYLTVAAVGFDALVSERTNKLKWPKGGARYYLAIIIELLRLKPQKFQIAKDGEPAIVAPGTLAAVGNTSSYGGGMPICPTADPSDGLLDLTHVAPLTRLKLLRLFPLLLKGTHTKRTEVTTGRHKTVKIAAPGLIVYADGERIGSETVTIKVIPKALKINVPN